MKKYIIDYTKLSQAEAMAYQAQRSLSRENYGVAIRHINEVREMLQEFKAAAGATICGDLKGIKTKQMLCSCDDCVRYAVAALEKHMD